MNTLRALVMLLAASTTSAQMTAVKPPIGSATPAQVELWKANAHEFFFANSPSFPALQNLVSGLSAYDLGGAFAPGLKDLRLLLNLGAVRLGAGHPRIAEMAQAKADVAAKLTTGPGKQALAAGLTPAEAAFLGVEALDRLDGFLEAPQRRSVRGLAVDVHRSLYDQVGNEARSLVAQAIEAWASHPEELLPAGAYGDGAAAHPEAELQKADIGFIRRIPQGPPPPVYPAKIAM